jgi:glycosyltransferase involved in cell wall biosynthesis
MNNPLVSVIIPLYNTEKYIEKAVNSVINQTYQKWQLIIIDDCSSDSSLDIVLNIRKQNKLSKEKMVIKKMNKNMGTYVALNVGLTLAKGKFFCVLGSDDTYIPEKLQIQIDEFKKNSNLICVMGKYIRQDLNGDISTDFGISKNQMKKGVFGECTSMYKMSLINQIGYYDSVRYGADTTFWERINKIVGPRNTRVKLLNKILYNAVKRPERLTQHSTLSNRKIYMRNFEKWLNKGNYYISFSLKNRPFPVPADMLP